MSVYKQDVITTAGCRISGHFLVCGELQQASMFSFANAPVHHADPIISLTCGRNIMGRDAR